MANSQLNNSTRLNLLAIFVGIVSVLSLLLLFVLLTAGFGIWRFNFDGLSQLDTLFKVWGAAGLLMCLYAGSYIASLTSREGTRFNGALQGFVIWACICLLGILILNFATDSFFYNMTTFELWLVFVGDLLAIAASISGGVQGIKRQRLIQQLEEKKSTYNKSNLEPSFARTREDGRQFFL